MSTTIIKKITLKNFLSYADQSFDFSDHSGMNIICGVNKDISGARNGCGKSVLCLSPVYAFYGELPYTLRKENILNRYVDEKNMEVSLEFNANGKDYIINRGIKKTTSFCNLYEKNGKGEWVDITKSTISETSKFVEKELIKCDIDTFMRFTVLNTDPYYNFFNLKKADKQEFLTKLFHLERYNEMYVKLHAKLNGIKDELKNKNTEIMSLNKNDEDYKRLSENFELKKDQSIDELTKKLDSLSEEYEKKSGTVVQRNMELLNKYNDGIAKIDGHLENFRNSINAKNVEIMKLSQQIKANEASIKKERTDIGKLSKVQGKLCDECTEIVNKCFNIDTKEALCSKLESENIVLGDKIATIKSSIAELNEKILKYKSNRDKLVRAINNQNSEYEDFQRKIRLLDRDIQILKTKIETTRNSANPYSQMLVSNRENLDKAMEELAVITRNQKQTKLAETVVSPEMIKNVIIPKNINIINNRNRYYLHRLGSNCDVQFDNNMDCEFITTDGAHAEFRNFSSGEQMRLAIASCFANRDLLSMKFNISFNVLLLDEYIDSNLDSFAIENLLTILKEISEENGQNIYIISHRQEVMNNASFNEMIEVVKENNISTINCKKI